MDMLEAVKEILSNQLRLDADEIDQNTDILNDLGADSLDLVDFVMSLEDEFDKEIPDEDVENIRTIGDIVSYIENSL